MSSFSTVLFNDLFTFAWTFLSGGGFKIRKKRSKPTPFIAPYRIDYIYENVNTAAEHAAVQSVLCINDQDEFMEYVKNLHRRIEYDDAFFGSREYRLLMKLCNWRMSKIEDEMDKKKNSLLSRYLNNRSEITRTSVWNDEYMRRARER